MILVARAKLLPGVHNLIVEGVCLLVGCLLLSSNKLVYLRDGSCQTVLGAVTLR